MKNGNRTQAAAAGEGIAVGLANSSLGTVLVGATSKGLRFVKIGDDAASLRNDLSRHLGGAPHEDHETADAIAHSVAKLIDDPAHSFDTALDIRGTAFQQTVWQALREIPPGSTVTYAGLAAKIGRTSAIRAVARACATNDLAVIIPCHRVIGSDGSLTGYRWGIDRKRALLEREANAIFSNPD